MKLNLKAILVECYEGRHDECPVRGNPGRFTGCQCEHHEEKSMGNNVVVIYCSEDGDKSIYRYTKEEFTKEIERMVEDGESPKFAKPGDVVDSGFMDSFAGYIIIDGDVIEPKPVKVTTKFKL
jgi:hypothetical protein